WLYLGMKVSLNRIWPSNTTIHADVKTLHDVQKLVGDIQWLRNWAGISNTDLEPLFALLKNSSDPTEH
ncbi:POK18 protein, partial [Polioptila caerulea]|nr:POK18 protein [Polioptila caerulea]